VTGDGAFCINVGGMVASGRPPPHICPFNARSLHPAGFLEAHSEIYRLLL
jgi:hypothetical protein